MNKEQRIFKKVIKRRRIAEIHRRLTKLGIEYGKPKQITLVKMTKRLGFWLNLFNHFKRLWEKLIGR